MPTDPTTAAAVMPPEDRLLALDDQLLARVVLAMGVWGAWWHPWADGVLELRMPGGMTAVLIGGGAPPTVARGLPDPFTDPAAAWELMVRERIGMEPAFSSEHTQPWEARWTRPTYGNADERAADEAINEPARALVLAALHKYAADPALAPLIRPLLERMEKNAA